MHTAVQQSAYAEGTSIQEGIWDWRLVSSTALCWEFLSRGLIFWVHAFHRIALQPIKMQPVILVSRWIITTSSYTAKLAVVLPKPSVKLSFLITSSHSTEFYSNTVFWAFLFISPMEIAIDQKQTGPLLPLFNWEVLQRQELFVFCFWYLTCLVSKVSLYSFGIPFDISSFDSEASLHFGNLHPLLKRSF